MYIGFLLHTRKLVTMDVFQFLSHLKVWLLLFLAKLGPLQPELNVNVFNTGSCHGFLQDLAVYVSPHHESIQWPFNVSSCVSASLHLLYVCGRQKCCATILLTIFVNFLLNFL